MKTILDKLSHSAWGGIGAIAAVIGVIFTINIVVAPEILSNESEKQVKKMYDLKSTVNLDRPIKTKPTNINEHSHLNIEPDKIIEKNVNVDRKIRPSFDIIEPCEMPSLCAAIINDIIGTKLPIVHETPSRNDCCTIVLGGETVNIVQYKATAAGKWANICFKRGEKFTYGWVLERYINKKC